MTYDQILLDIFNNLQSLQIQALELFQVISENNKETVWNVWSKYHIPNILQLVAIGVGYLAIRQQIQKQHKSNLLTQDEKIRMAMHVFHKDFMTISQSYMLALLKVLPMDAPNGLINQPLPTPQQEKSLKELGEKYSNVLEDLGGYLMDLRTAVQTLALGKLFPNNKVGIRQPIDPNIIVIKTDAKHSTYEPFRVMFELKH